ncbi:hypothetical protein LX36DRAFT_42576 [Colletotrichum falcatum]|nr:hypothetical protein LX36DRAFT_42576 [Colletotrichum falcatum]
MRWTSFWSSRRTRHQTREREREESWTGKATESPGRHRLQEYSEDCLNSIESFPAAVRLLVWLSVNGSLSDLSLNFFDPCQVFFFRLFFSSSFSCFLLNPAPSRFLGSGTLQSNHTPGRSSFRINF